MNSILSYVNKKRNVQKNTDENALVLWPDSGNMSTWRSQKEGKQAPEDQRWPAHDTQVWNHKECIWSCPWFLAQSLKNPWDF